MRLLLAKPQPSHLHRLLEVALRLGVPALQWQQRQQAGGSGWWAQRVCVCREGGGDAQGGRGGGD